jgi:hypothetical protein
MGIEIDGKVQWLFGEIWMENLWLAEWIFPGYLTVF